MKGFAKAIKRTPHLVTTKVGMSKKSSDPEFEEYHRAFQTLEQSTEKLLKDTKAFSESVVALFTAGVGFANHFKTLFEPISGEYNLIGKHPEAEHTIRNVAPYQEAMDELQSTIAPELELIESRVAGPTKELQSVLKTIRKTITKREHKLIDYDRFNNSLTKLRDKKEKSLSDEKNLFKLEQDFEVATNEYDYINTALKTDLPRFMVLATQFIDPLFHSFFYMQLNVFYMLLEKMQQFADGKFDVANVPGSQIAADYEEKRTDAWQQIENLNITKRMISTSKFVQQTRAQGGLSAGSSLNRASSTASASTVSSRSAAPQRTPSSSYVKKAPPPPPSASFNKAPSPVPAAPPPYTPSSAGNAAAAAAAAAAKRAPPPPPPLKPKPQAAQYVVALYDFEAQADGDLSFKTGDRIEIVEKTASAEDWWTGRLNGQQGVFPGNYVQEA
ncbi:BAR-domain-containing protein [Punctularia strigosozonata HHB-11173 SS5]|uniref:BAR-domain-containing protein n=1 Tax=Punctularia strigosozonata (strain HHB-11173) TaxID=741275 RepID=UPI00044177FB|nr:BAR-domain-containing protein [Punctularia strigosozonata HHB-11173 SS5]EIN13473.1 BAR-domain-containing protein [Punctularia strigosozonata HHB-11173 SS5]